MLALPDAWIWDSWIADDGEALGPQPGGWDDLALWTGSVARGDDGEWALIGFRNLEPEGVHAFEILDPITVHLDDGALVAGRSHVS